MAYCTAVKFCGNKDCSDLPFPWYCSAPWRSTWQPSGTRALGHPSSRCNLCLQCFHYGNQGKALIKTCTHRVGCSAWSVSAMLHFLCLLCTLCWLRNNLLLITNPERATSDFRMEDGWALMTAERGEWTTAFTFAALLPSDFALLGTLYEEQLPEGQPQHWISPQAPLWKKCTLVIYRKTTLQSVSLVNEDPTHFSHLHCHSCWVFAALWAICEMSAAHSLQSLAQQKATQHFAALGDHGVTGIYVWAGSGCFFLHSLLQAAQAPCSLFRALPELSLTRTWWSRCAEEEQIKKLIVVRISLTLQPPARSWRFWTYNFDFPS